MSPGSSHGIEECGSFLGGDSLWAEKVLTRPVSATIVRPSYTFLYIRFIHLRTVWKQPKKGDGNRGHKRRPNPLQRSIGQNVLEVNLGQRLLDAIHLYNSAIQ